ncbi:MAG: IS200/IS605 family element transposase accessory protein TnpB [Taibaiella sp.]|nr:IS200/IS605 family element transposase accessory protein TnpB [Taibaiella sp.]
MKLTISIQLKPDEKQAKRLLNTLEKANEAANAISEQAWDTRTFQQFKLHGITYHWARETFELTAQMVVRIIAKVSDAYKLDKKRQRVFRKHGSIAYDDRILRYQTDKVSIWTLKGRETIPFVCGEYQQKLLQFRKGESDLVYRDGKWYLFAVVDVIEPAPDEPDDFLGVDLGIVQIATMSNGEAFAGNTVNNVRARNVKLRAKLQSKGTKSAKRLLKKRNSKEVCFAKQVNHHISKRIVQTAKAQGQGIAIENLMGIRDRVRLRRRQRSTLHSWSFYQLASFILYKARKEGVHVEVVNPRYTSQTCAECGYSCKANRRTQSQFLCVGCGVVANADHNASKIISYLGRAAVNRPYAVSYQSARLEEQLQCPAL